MNKPKRAERAPNAAMHSWSERVRNFTPNWFAITMGTGIVSLVLAGLPLHFKGQHELASALWSIDVALYTIFTVMFVGRLIRFSETIRPLLHHPVQSMFLGAVPMGLVPIINGIVLFQGDRFGVGAYTVAYVLWCADALLSVVVAVGVPFMIFTEQGHAFERVTAVLLLPIVAPEVAASSAAMLAPHFAGASARLLIGAGYILWAISVPLAFSLLTIVFFRLVIHKLPHRDLGPSSWLTLGPIGTGALGLLTLGQAAPIAFAGTPLVAAAIVARDFGVVASLLLWAAGLWWLTCAILFTLRYCREGLPFNLGWWGFTFPLGVYTAATLSLYHVTGYEVFSTFGVLLALLLGGLWAMVVAKTCQAAAHGNLFRAPCLTAASQ
ncbi:C4-dicarboxylate ABC transporter [Burkholderia ubonensis]|uniref:TDT family transporter n=1 Tax=Burkholderia ubonensis TaxID=101571 RepID=UPI000755887C|nr:TDT family transporter [Burkholderia ubonensis]KWB77687.1 C4-dicarboxylate ABC transporter [Burkholderia ubonensis]